MRHDDTVVSLLLPASGLDNRMDELDQRILRLLSENPKGLQSREIAQRLSADRHAINQHLYRSLRGQVRQDRSYRWTLLSIPAQTEQFRAEKTRTSELFQYYLDCLRYDDDSGISVFAESNTGTVDYAELQAVPAELWDQGVSISWSTFEPLQRLRRLIHTPKRRLTLSIGYPVLVRSVTAKSGWQGRFLEPILYWPLEEAEQSNIVPQSGAILNTKALSALIKGENPVELSAILAGDLGLDSVGGALEELMLRLQGICEQWPWRETIEPAAIGSAPAIAEVAQDGIYNRIAFFAAERPPYTIGLERELHDLQAVPEEEIKSTALGYLLHDRARSRPATGTGPLLEPVPLNTEQRDAVERSLSQPITVITGPPGTGKSQVVCEIVINAAYQGQRILFASKNHKAVDVVLERVNDLTIRPVILQLGSRGLQEVLADHISAFLSAKTTQEDIETRGRARKQLSELTQTYSEVSEQLAAIIKQRNLVDELDQERDRAMVLVTIEPARFPLEDGIRRALEELKASLAAATRASRKTNYLSVILPFISRSRRERLEHAVTQVVTRCQGSLLAPLVSTGGDLLTRADALLTFLDNVLEVDTTAREYARALHVLQLMPSPELLARRRMALIDSVAAVSSELWQVWQSTMGEEVTGEDRRVLGDYAALLRTIARAQDESETVGATIWRHYYAAASEASRILPCWAVTSLSARGRIPLEPGVFDVLVIDEASQCDIASALPLLYRASRAVIIGDPQQLRHISVVSPERDRQLLESHGVLEWPGASWSYASTGLYDLCQSRVTSDDIVTLRDHHRSHEDIIGFSNRHFYQGRLRIATKYDHLRHPSGPAVRWINVEGECIRPREGGACNPQEAEEVLRALRDLVFEKRFDGEIGVVTPFRQQANLIRELVLKDAALYEALLSRNFLSETAHRFQGDERDVMIFSTVVSANMSDGTKRFLRSSGNIFNVAATRARGAFWVVGSRSACRASGVPYLEAYVEYVDELEARGVAQAVSVEAPRHGREYPTVARPELVSDWERVLYTLCWDAGIKTLPQYEVDQYVLDLAVFSEDGRKLDVEVDGERFHRNWDGELVRQDQIRNMRLIEMGWDVMRFWVYQIRDTPDEVVSRIGSWLSAETPVEQQTAAQEV